MNYKNLFLIFAVICFQILWYYIFKFCGRCTLPPLGAVIGAEGLHYINILVSFLYSAYPVLFCNWRFSINGMLMNRKRQVIATGPTKYQRWVEKPLTETYMIQMPHHIEISPK